jgi:hypothetical protein
MSALTIRIALCGALLTTAVAAAEPRDDAAAAVAIRTGIGFLATEVPAWRRENGCFSCHNNGDGARALYQASRAGFEVKDSTLHETTEWLAQPGNWSDNRGDDEFNDPKLAALQFAAALLESQTSDRGERRSEALTEAARLVATFQEPDGSWRPQTSGLVGSPITWGRILSTAIACDVLNAADPMEFRPAIVKADRWLRESEPKNVLDAAALLWGLSSAKDQAAAAQREKALVLIREGENPDGGWGPYVTSATQTFDTALTLLALSRLDPTPETQRLIRRGTEQLVKLQLEDGSWPPTTRPPGANSYAHRISTSAWALQALLAVRDRLK